MELLFLVGRGKKKRGKKKSELFSRGVATWRCLFRVRFFSSLMKHVIWKIFYLSSSIKMIFPSPLMSFSHSLEFISHKQFFTMSLRFIDRFWNTIRITKSRCDVEKSSKNAFDYQMNLKLNLQFLFYDYSK